MNYFLYFSNVYTKIVLKNRKSRNFITFNARKTPLTRFNSLLDRERAFDRVYVSICHLSLFHVSLFFIPQKLMIHDWSNQIKEWQRKIKFTCVKQFAVFIYNHHLREISQEI